MNRVCVKHNIILCKNNDKQSCKSEKLVHKRRLLKIKTDIKLKLNDKRQQAIEYCEDCYYNEYDYYCINLLQSIELLEQKHYQVDMLLKHFKDL